MSSSAFAAGSRPGSRNLSSGAATAANNPTPGTERQKRFSLDANLTDEQKAELEAKKAELEAKRAEEKAKADALAAAWNALSAEQKEEVYKLHDDEIDARIATIDKYLSLGLISADDAAALKEKMTAEKAAVRESGNMPFLGKGSLGSKGGFRHGHGKCDKIGAAPSDGITTAIAPTSL